jgi:CheY-specific phosphatase CheX
METFRKTFDAIDTSMTQTFCNIYKTMTDLDTSIVPNPNMNDFKRNYSTAMGLNGDVHLDGKKYQLKGSVIICWEMSGYVKMAGRMMGEEYQDYSPEIDDVGMEVLNTAVGNSKPLLNEAGVFIQMSLPTGFIGNQKITESGKNVFSSMHVYDTEVGKVCLLINCLIDE